MSAFAVSPWQELVPMSAVVRTTAPAAIWRLGPYDVRLAEAEPLAGMLTDALLHFGRPRYGWRGAPPKVAFEFSKKSPERAQMTVVLTADVRNLELARRIVDGALHGQ